MEEPGTSNRPQRDRTPTYHIIVSQPGDAFHDGGDHLLYFVCRDKDVLYMRNTERAAIRIMKLCRMGKEAQI